VLWPWSKELEEGTLVAPAEWQWSTTVSGNRLHRWRQLASRIITSCQVQQKGPTNTTHIQHINPFIFILFFYPSFFMMHIDFLSVSILHPRKWRSLLQPWTDAKLCLHRNKIIGVSKHRLTRPAASTVYKHHWKDWVNRKPKYIYIYILGSNFTLKTLFHIFISNVRTACSDKAKSCWTHSKICMIPMNIVK
jgi:hypothetical protein